MGCYFKRALYSTYCTRRGLQGGGPQEHLPPGHRTAVCQCQCSHYIGTLTDLHRLNLANPSQLWCRAVKTPAAIKGLERKREEREGKGREGLEMATEASAAAVAAASSLFAVSQLEST